MKEKLKKGLLTASLATGTILATGIGAFAAEETSVSSIITTATTGVLADSKIVIASALSIGVVFFGAKLLWGKFKSMAR